MSRVLEIFHADSLAGPMLALKEAFETNHRDITIRLTSGVSKQLAARIAGGERCDVFASSSPAVIEQELMKPGEGTPVALWCVVFSANEMVVITARDNPLKIARMSDLAAPGLRLARVTGDRDLATQRTIDFVRRAAASDGAPDLAGQIIDSAPDDPTRAVPVPTVIDAVRSGGADAGIVYLSAAVAAGPDIFVLRFPANVNVSEAIRNAATVPATAREAAMGEAFIAFILTPEGRKILEATGQPPVAPPDFIGTVPPGFR